MIPKGSVAVDGVSLTVVEVTADSFSVALIPHTLDNTTLGRMPVGATVNIETDVIGKYVLKFVGRLFEGVTIEKLRSAGMIS
jgi:riboflavin synthase